MPVADILASAKLSMLDVQVEDLLRNSKFNFEVASQLGILVPRGSGIRKRWP